MRKKALRRRRKLSEAEVRKIVRDELRNGAEELAPLVLAEMLRSERQRPGKVKGR